jgi:predicted metalloendopeptidase
MARFYCEDVATSAIGRAIIILKGSQKTATNESMARAAEVHDEVAKVKAKMAQTSSEYIPVAKADDPWTIAPAQQAQTLESAVEMVKSSLGGTTPDESCIHGARVWKTGTSKAGKPWGHWKCVAQIMGDAERCEPIWYEIDKETGQWKPQVKR